MALSLPAFAKTSAKAGGKPAEKPASKGTAKLIDLPIPKLEEMKKKPCALLHVWATWCDICVQEMPGLIGYLGKSKKITPVIVDVSSKFVQDNFSRKWDVLLDAPFNSYLKPDGNDEAYVNAIDTKWGGALPYSVLYHGGKKKEEWLGALDNATLDQAIATHCR